MGGDQRCVFAPFFASNKGFCAGFNLVLFFFTEKSLFVFQKTVVEPSLETCKIGKALHLAAGLAV